MDEARRDRREDVGLTSTTTWRGHRSWVVVRPIRHRRWPPRPPCCTGTAGALNLGQPGGLDINGGGVRLIDATDDGPWELPALGAVTAAAVLIRPDGDVAWVETSPAWARRRANT
jgi:hypothetical protein